MDNQILREDIEFYSNETKCRAWLYLPRTKKSTIIVMAHGLGSVREMRLDAYAERFAAAGYTCFLFDYRNFGASDGDKRQRINVKDQLMDWNSAINFIKQDERFNSHKVLLFGSSFSGGHVITLSSRRKDIAGAVAQCPYTNTWATAKTISPRTAFKTLPAVIADLISCLTGYHPVMLRLADARGKAAIMAVPDYEGYLQQVPKNSNFRNTAPARTLLEFFKYSPCKYTKDINVPIYYAVCQKDTLAPAKTTIKYARFSKKAIIKEYDCGHFDIYLGQYFEKAITNYIDFFNTCIK